MSTVSVPIYVSAEGFAPSQPHAGDIGWNLYSTVDTMIYPNTIQPIDTGVVVAVPEGFELQIRPRSGLSSKHGITVINTPGTVDRGYRGSIKVALINLGEDIYHVKRGDAIAQAVLAPVPTVSFLPVSSPDLLPPPPDSRGDGGFGSTGR